MKALDFMIIGAQKSGTTALAQFLSQHSEITVADEKEVHLFDDPAFDDHWSTDEISAKYASHFSSSEAGNIFGEATPIYLFLPKISERLWKYKPDLKLIIVLRDPVQRAYSQYLMERMRGNERLPFWLSLLLEKLRLKLDRDPFRIDSAHRVHSYRARGLYSKQLSELYKFFPRKQIMILRNEDLRDTHEETMRRVFTFLDVSIESIVSMDVFSNQSDVAHVPVSAYFLRKSYQKELKRLESMLEFSVKSWS